MKYEAVFGDQSLFDGADEDVVLAETNGVYRTFHKESDKPYNVASVSRSDLAMRRIIAEPKRWTVEDKKAGRLPEVWCECWHCKSKSVKSVIAVTATHIVINANNSIGIAPWLLLHDEFMQYYIPIETPEEKAKREEDGFVMSLMLTSVHSGTSDEYFMQGARAAYRKLKGGE